MQGKNDSKTGTRRLRRDWFCPRVCSHLLLLKIYFLFSNMKSFFFLRTRANKQTKAAKRRREERGIRGEAGSRNLIMLKNK